MTSDTKELTNSAKKMPPRAGMGRPAGTLNKTTRALKEAILIAAEQVGEDGKGKHGLVGYLRRVATEDVRAFAGLLGKVLPMQITGAEGRTLAQELGSLPKDIPPELLGRIEISTGGEADA
ncbi:MAG TPA: hypothetical protein PLL72_00285 [Burkholderiaceae bacterium]|nr:hypothetical protein [Burkholderiaceae bacterium]